MWRLMIGSLQNNELERIRNKQLFPNLGYVLYSFMELGKSLKTTVTKPEFETGFPNSKTNPDFLLILPWLYKYIIHACIRTYEYIHTYVYIHTYNLVQDYPTDFIKIYINIILTSTSRSSKWSSLSQCSPITTLCASLLFPFVPRSPPISFFFIVRNIDSHSFSNSHSHLCTIPHLNQPEMLSLAISSQRLSFPELSILQAVQQVSVHLMITV
jgi:hypothetical protein